MPDQITILRSRRLTMAKRWCADGTIEPYQRARNFTHEQREIDGIEALSDLLGELEAEPFACIIRGTPKPGSPPSLRRLLENFDDIPLHFVCIEVDEYRPLLSDPLDGESAAREFISEHLPEPFHIASFHWQLSNSAGAPGKEGVFKAHLWFWLFEPYDSATLRAWATSHAPNIDRAVLQPVQVHYCAAPLFDEGVVDPVAKRSGFHSEIRSEVQLSIDLSDLDIKAHGARQRGERREVQDPQADWIETNWETWGHLADGGVIVSCPFAEQHSGGASGDTSTVYFPAGTNSYAEGSWVCLHNSCRDRHQGEFHQASGWLDSKLGAITVEPAPKTQINGTKVNGVHLPDPLILPGFKRKPSGAIDTCMINVKLALEDPKVAGMMMRYDVFKDAVVCSQDDRNWRPFTDSDYTDLRLRLEDVGVMSVGREMIRDSVHHVAQLRSFDTAIEWLDGLTWDGVPRVETFWIDHFGVLDDSIGYARAVAKYTWSAMAARVLEPGAQADMVPVLSGRQGMRKSRGVAAMSPTPEFATHMSFHEPEIERARKMRGKLVVELAELQGLHSRDGEEILAWITRSEEHWTPKFMEMTTQYRRRFLMIATTNGKNFLDNPDGERRWLPMGAGRTEGFDQVDTDRLADEREQLWAEGREMYVKHGVLWRDAEHLARDEVGQWKSDDSWRAAVTRWLDTPSMHDETPRQRGFITLLEVAEGALGMSARSMRHTDQTRLAKVLRQEGYEQVLKRLGNKPIRGWAPEFL